MKLTPAQRVVLAEAANGALTHVDAVRLGGNGRTLSSLTDKGLLTPRFTPTGRDARRWYLTDAGRKLLETTS